MVAGLTLVVKVIKLGPCPLVCWGLREALAGSIVGALTS
jgi:hypothetical protein